MKAQVTLDDGTQYEGTLTKTGSQPAPPSDVVNEGGELTQPRVGYAFGVGKTHFFIHGNPGEHFTIESVPAGAGYGEGSVSAEGETAYMQAIGNGTAPAFPVTANGDGFVDILVECNAPGLIRYWPQPQ